MLSSSLDLRAHPSVSLVLWQVACSPPDICSFLAHPPPLCPPTPGPPYATTVPEHASVRAGETVQLQCLAHGTPPLTFQWSRVGGSLPRRVTARNEMLRFEPVAPEDTGRYRCQVTNRVGSAEAFAQVLVQGEQPSSGWAEGGQPSSQPFTYPATGTWGPPLGAQRPPSITPPGMPFFFPCSPRPEAGLPPPGRPPSLCSQQL